ncbi:MAG: hypothetical protein JKY50_18665 [Oleispira sp.]|nr:hypothetical protein [Oleispira sp.]
MEIKKVRAAFDKHRLEAVQKALVAHAVTDFSTDCAEGEQEGDRANRAVMIKNAQLEIYINAEYAKKVADLIESVASVNGQNAVVISVETVDGLFGNSNNNKDSWDAFNYKK